MVHCCYGAVVCHDVLMYNTPHTVYLINECQVPYPSPVMCIRTLTGEQAAEWWNTGGFSKMPLYYGEEWQGRYDDVKEEATPVVPDAKPVKTIAEEKGKWVQLTLFD